MEEMEEYSITEKLPNHLEKVLCFGHLTYCCSEDMEKKPDWHEVIFEFELNSYKLKKHIPMNPEESILERYTVQETWNKLPKDEFPFHIIGVTKWKKIES